MKVHTLRVMYSGMLSGHKEFYACKQCKPILRSAHTKVGTRLSLSHYVSLQLIHSYTVVISICSLSLFCGM